MKCNLLPNSKENSLSFIISKCGEFDKKKEETH